MKLQHVTFMLILAVGVLCLVLIFIDTCSSTFGLISPFPTMAKSAVGSGPITSERSIQIKELLRHGVDGSQPPRRNNRSIITGTLYEETSLAILSRNSMVNVTLVNIGKNISTSTPWPAKPIALMQNNASKSAEASLYGRDDSGHINPHGYRLLKDEPLACYDANGKLQEVFLLVFILTVHTNVGKRAAIRDTWGSPQEVGGKRIVTLFLLAYNDNAQLQRQVDVESNKHHDLLQEDFMDTYKNLTLKTIMGMKWAYSHCPHASYVMKTDDDMYVSYANLVEHLADSKTPSVNYAAGFLINSGPIRNRMSKWYMPKEIYPSTKYPPFLSGTGYVMSGDLTEKIYERSLDTKYLHLEDVFVAVCLTSLHIKPIRKKGFNNWRTWYSYCRYRSLITTHMVPPAEMRRIWKDQQRQIPCNQ